MDYYNLAFQISIIMGLLSWGVGIYNKIRNKGKPLYYRIQFIAIIVFILSWIVVFLHYKYKR